MDERNCVLVYPARGKNLYFCDFKDSDCKIAKISTSIKDAALLTPLEAAAVKHYLKYRHRWLIYKKGGDLTLAEMICFPYVALLCESMKNVLQSIIDEFSSSRTEASTEDNK